MPVATALVEKLETRLPKVIDARNHGIIDYCHAALFLGMALVFRKKNPKAALASAVTGGFLLAESLLTDYPLGAARMIPFALHGQMDAGFAAASLAIPKVFGFAGTPAAGIFTANAFLEGAVVGMTGFDSAAARAEQLGITAAPGEPDAIAAD